MGGRYWIAAVAALLTACGGGGGDSGGPVPGPSVVPLTYSGNSGPAAVTTTNAGRLAANVTGGGDVAAATGSLATPGGGELGLLDVGRRLSRGFRATVAPKAGGQARPTAAPIDQTDPCAGGGTVRVFGSVSDTDGTGTLSIVFTNCVIGGEILSGAATMRVDAFDLGNSVITDFTLEFSRLSIRGAASLDLTGSIRTHTNLGTNTETVTENVIALYSNTGHLTKSENLVFIDVYNNIFSPASYTESISGRVFDSVHGYVDVITNAPFVFVSVSQLFPQSGQIVLTGASNARISVSALSSTLAELGLDLNGDNNYELTARVDWDEMSGAAGADLGDADGDGMHNSWETANNATDPAADPDGDGQNNLAEYLAGTDPHVSGGAPPPPPPPPPPGLPSPTPVAARIVTVANNSDIIFDPGTQRIYVAVLGNPGSVVPLDPVSETLGTAITVGTDPVKLARSDDNQFLYVGLSGQPAVQRIGLAAPQAVNLEFALGSDSFFGPFYAEDIEVLPGSPQSVAVSLINKGISPRHAGVAIFDDGNSRTDRTPRHTGANVIEFSASSGTLFGYNNETTGFGFYRMAVGPSGVSVSDVFDSFMANNVGGFGLISGFGTDIDFGGGLIFATTGRVVDPVARTVLGHLLLPDFSHSVVADGSLGRAFFLSQHSPGSAAGIVAYDIATRSLLGYASISGVTGAARSLIRWGANGLAFRTSTGQVVLVESAVLIP